MTSVSDCDETARSDRDILAHLAQNTLVFSAEAHGTHPAYTSTMDKTTKQLINTAKHLGQARAHLTIAQCRLAALLEKIRRG